MNKIELMKSFTNELRKTSKKEYTIYTLDTFLSLPRKAQEVVWGVIHEPEFAHIISTNGLYMEECINSPIEKIFYLTYKFLTDIFSEKLHVNAYFLTEQYQIKINNKKYIVDFYSESALFNKSDGTPIKSNAKIIIECDGHEFHQKTKEQVTKDNERQLDLQMAGYEVIRFSGSQIYNDPFGCAMKAYQFIDSKVNQT